MADFENERNIYKEKVAKQRDAIANLLSLAKSHSGLFEAGVVRQLESFQTKCNRLYRKLDKNEFEIAIVGLEKAGKSTFGNALMENRILPDADRSCPSSTRPDFLHPRDNADRSSLQSSDRDRRIWLCCNTPDRRGA